MSTTTTDKTTVPEAVSAKSLGSTFIDLKELKRRLPLCERTLREYTRTKKMPSIRLPGSRRFLYHWPSIESWLLRNQIGGSK